MKEIVYWHRGPLPGTEVVYQRVRILQNEDVKLHVERCQNGVPGTALVVHLTFERTAANFVRTVWEAPGYTSPFRKDLRAERAQPDTNTQKPYAWVVGKSVYLREEEADRNRDPFQPKKNLFEHPLPPEWIQLKVDTEFGDLYVYGPPESIEMVQEKITK